MHRVNVKILTHAGDTFTLQALRKTFQYFSFATARLSDFLKFIQCQIVE